VSRQVSNDNKPTARRAIKNFDQTFLKVWPPAGPPEAKKSSFRVLTGVQDGQAESFIIFFRFSAHPVDKNRV
jgi:hypothetical protein